VQRANLGLINIGKLLVFNPVPVVRLNVIPCISRASGREPCAGSGRLGPGCRPEGGRARRRPRAPEAEAPPAKPRPLRPRRRPGPWLALPARGLAGRALPGDRGRSRRPGEGAGGTRLCQPGGPRVQLQYEIWDLGRRWLGSSPRGAVPAAAATRDVRAGAPHRLPRARARTGAPAGIMAGGGGYIMPALGTPIGEPWIRLNV
jgi:hypothetical protein